MFKNTLIYKKNKKLKKRRMKVIVVRNDDKFLMILEFLHYHMDTTYLRELIRIDNTINEPRYMIAEPLFEWNDSHINKYESRFGK